jgi:hypothetical protein
MAGVVALVNRYDGVSSALAVVIHREALYLAGLPVFCRLGKWEERVSNAGFVGFCFYAKSCGTSARLGPGNGRAARLLWGLSVVMVGFMSFSCGSSHAILEISAPTSVVAGVPFTATVTAMYEGKPDTIIDGPIHFTSSDTAAILPTLYVFTAADAGSHTFTGLLLMTPGNQTMTVSDYDAMPIAGTVNITVAAAAGGP